MKNYEFQITNYELPMTKYKKVCVRLRSSAVKFSSSLCVSIFCFFTLSVAVQGQIAVKGETVWTMAGENITNGVVLVGANGKIEAVGAANQIVIPANYRVITAKVVTPGLIDAHTVVGLNGYMNQPQDQMALDGTSPMQPELRAIDAYNPEEKLIEWVRGFGVTTMNTGHQPGALISGQLMIVKTVGKTADEAAIMPVSMVAVTLGEDALGSGGKSPGTRGKQAAMLRAELLRATESNSKNTQPPPPATTIVTSGGRNNNDNSPTATNPNSMLENPPTENNRATQNGSGQMIVARQNNTDLRSDIMQRVIRREIPLLVTAQKAQDIITAIRLAKEFNIKIILDGVAEAQMVMNEIKASGFPVIVHPTMFRASGETENLSLEDAAKLKAAGIPFALQSGYEGYVPKTRVVLFEAGVAAANGLSPRDALATITIDAAKILGLDAKIGSLEKGKEADLAMYDGDPFEYATHCTGTIIGGKVVSETVR